MAKAKKVVSMMDLPLHDEVRKWLQKNATTSSSASIRAIIKSSGSVANKVSAINDLYKHMTGKDAPAYKAPAPVKLAKEEKPTTTGKKPVPESKAVGASGKKWTPPVNMAQKLIDLGAVPPPDPNATGMSKAQRASTLKKLSAALAQQGVTGKAAGVQAKKLMANALAGTTPTSAVGKKVLAQVLQPAGPQPQPALSGFQTTKGAAKALSGFGGVKPSPPPTPTMGQRIKGALPKTLMGKGALLGGMALGGYAAAKLAKSTKGMSTGTEGVELKMQQQLALQAIQDTMQKQRPDLHQTLLNMVGGIPPVGFDLSDDEVVIGAGADPAPPRMVDQRAVRALLAGLKKE